MNLRTRWAWLRAQLELRFWFWRYFLSHTPQDFKWSLLRAGYIPTQLSPNCWRWDKPGTSFYLRITEKKL